MLSLDYEGKVLARIDDVEKINQVIAMVDNTGKAAEIVKAYRDRQDKWESSDATRL